MYRTVLAVVAVAVGVTVVAAQSDSIAQRKGLMKSLAAATKAGSMMVKGDTPYDQAKAQQVVATFIEVSQKMPTLFPDTSKTGGDTAALPHVWENTADFKARFDKMGAEAKAAQNSVKDLDSFKGAFGGLTKNCGGCHENYRAKKT
jgi:cytochrome c556